MDEETLILFLAITAVTCWLISSAISIYIHLGK